MSNKYDISMDGMRSVSNMPFYGQVPIKAVRLAPQTSPPQKKNAYAKKLLQYVIN